jgi:hypothetical protein
MALEPEFCFAAIQAALDGFFTLPMRSPCCKNRIEGERQAADCL